MMSTEGGGGGGVRAVCAAVHYLLEGTALQLPPPKSLSLFINSG